MSRRHLVPIVAQVTLALCFVVVSFVSHAQSAAAPAVQVKRQKVCLVLSGGGARGIAHVGVLKVLDELRVPVDCIAATSMGAIVGGLSAIGVTPAEMQERLAKVEWGSLFSDSPPRRDLDIRRKDEDARYPVPLEFGFSEGAVHLAKGAIAGGNLELYLHELTRRADGVASFDRLPTPFRAVATDMVTGEKHVFDGGPLYVAIRASMSVPGLFTPMEVDGRIFGDGGLVDNLPVDIVRQMGADVIIAVNIGTPLMNAEQLQSIVGLTAQSLNILTQQNVRASIALLRQGPHVLISPDLGKLTFADFSSGPRLIELGEAAARVQADALAKYALPQDAWREFVAARTVLPPIGDPIVARVSVEGAVRANPAVLLEQVDSVAGKPFDAATVDADVARLYGSGDYERVSYRLIDEKGQRDLVFDVTEKTWGPNYLRFGLNLSSDLQGESFFNVLIGHKRTWINSLGAQWINEITFGQTRRYATEFYQPLEKSQTYFGSLYGEIMREPTYFYDGDLRIAQYDVLTERAGFDFGTNFGELGELRIGPQFSHYRADREVAVGEFPSSFELDEAGVSVRLRYDRLDDPFFARNGLRVNAEFFQGIPGIGSETDVTRGELEFLQAFPFGEDGRLHLGGRFGASDRRDTTGATDYQLGGFLNLSGLRVDQLNGDYMGFLRAVYYHRMGPLRYIGRAWYLGGSLEIGNTWQSRDAISFSDTYKAGSVFLGADTYLGPFYLAWGHTNRGESSWYIYLGRP
ncbi:MAG: patatin-like phospholipase family protein [Casimicrobiaceae bacterium]